MGEMKMISIHVKIALLGLCSLWACTSEVVDVVTTQPVDVFELPKRPDVVGNKRIGVLPAGIRLPVKNEVLQKDMAAYEIDYIDSATGDRTKGYVILGSPGLDIQGHR